MGRSESTSTLSSSKRSSTARWRRRCHAERLPRGTEDASQGPLMFTERQASDVLGMTPTGLKEERLKGRIGFVRRGRQIRYLREHLSTYVDEWKKATES